VYTILAPGASLDSHVGCAPASGLLMPFLSMPPSVSQSTHPRDGSSAPACLENPSMANTQTDMAFLPSVLVQALHVPSWLWH
jgi:hypothetical protein